MIPAANRPLEIAGQMLLAASQARSYVEGMSREDFLADPKTQDAVIMKILVIGELAAKILEKHADFASSHRNARKSHGST